MLSCELVKDKKTFEPVAQEKAFDVMLTLRNRGVLISVCGRYGNVFQFMPPLTTPKAYFEKAADIYLGILKDKEENLMQ